MGLSVSSPVTSTWLVEHTNKHNEGPFVVFRCVLLLISRRFNNMINRESYIAYYSSM